MLPVPPQRWHGCSPISFPSPSQAGTYPWAQSGQVSDSSLIEASARWLAECGACMVFHRAICSQASAPMKRHRRQQSAQTTAFLSSRRRGSDVPPHDEHRTAPAGEANELSTPQFGHVAWKRGLYGLPQMQIISPLIADISLRPTGVGCLWFAGGCIALLVSHRATRYAHPRFFHRTVRAGCSILGRTPT